MSPFVPFGLGRIYNTNLFFQTKVTLSPFILISIIVFNRLAALLMDNIILFFVLFYNWNNLVDLSIIYFEMLKLFLYTKRESKSSVLSGPYSFPHFSYFPKNSPNLLRTKVWNYLELKLFLLYDSVYWYARGY